MSRSLKERIEKEYGGRYSAAREALLVNVIGLSGVDANRLRGVLRGKKIDMHVVRNRAFQRALAGGALAPLVKHMEGPCALVTTQATIVEVAKELVRIAAEYPKLELKIGLVEGFDEPLTVEQVSKLRTRLETIGDVLVLAISPGRRLAAGLKAPASRIAGCIKTIQDRLEKSEAISKVA